jgi:anti-sigma factor RsiW
VKCDEVIEQLHDYLDEDARRELCEAIEAHLEHCSECKVKVDKLKKTITLYRGDVPIDMPARVSDELRAAMSRTYGEGGQRAD